MAGLRHIGQFIIVLTVLSYSAAATDCYGAETTWKAGVGRVKITPEHFMWMAGYGARKHPAEGKYAELWAKALVLEDAAGHRGVLVTLDLIGIARDLSRAICDRLLQQYGIARNQIVLCFSHTHTGPVVGKNLEPLHYWQVDAEQRKLIDQYAAELPSRISTAVGQAIDNMQPCTLQWGSGTAPFAVNRRNNPEAKVPELRAAGKLQGPIDHDVPVLAIRSPENKLLAVVFGYACHGTVLSDYAWSGDYPGFAQLELEMRHPGCQAMFWAGCGGDQNPLPRRKLELAKKYGRQLADAVDKVLAKKMVALPAPLKTMYREIPLALDQLPDRKELEIQAKSDNKFIRSRAEMLLERIAAGQPLAQYYPYPISIWRFDNQVTFIALGGETVVDYALRLKSELGGKRVWVAGYSNDVMAYIPSLRVLHEGGYEGATAMIYYGLPTSWSAAVEETVVGAVHAMLDASKCPRSAKRK